MDRRGFIGGLLALAAVPRTLWAKPVRPMMVGPAPAHTFDSGKYKCSYTFYDAETGIEIPITPQAAEIHGRKVYWTR